MSEPTIPPGPPSDTPPPPPGGGAPPPPPSGSGPGAPPPPSGGTGGGAPGAPPPPTGGTESPNRGLMIVLSYLWILALIPLLTEKSDKEVQWHAKHGLVLMVAEILVSILIMVVSGVTAMIDFGCSGCILHTVFWIAVLVVHVLCIMKGVNGERFRIPGISQYADRF